MNLLLLLSALFSAITGVAVGPQRMQVAAEQVAAQAARTVVRVAVEPRATLHVMEIFDVAAARRAVSPLVRLPVGTIALYANRRRE